MNEHLDYDSLRADTVRQVGKAHGSLGDHGAQIRRDNSSSQASTCSSKPVIVDDRDTLTRLAAWMRAGGKERREAIYWFRDAEAAEAIDAVLFVGLNRWYPPNYDCGACAYATCAEFMRASKQACAVESEELEFIGPQCNLRDIDLGIAVGSAAKTAAIHSIETHAAKHTSRSRRASSA